MTTNFTQFLSAYIAAWPDNVTDPDLSRWTAAFSREIRYNNEKKNVQEMGLNSGGSATITISGLAQVDWHCIVVRCIGQGYIALAGQDASSSGIASNVPIYGTTVLPGIVFISTYNLTADPVVHSLADGSIFEVFEATCVEDGD